METIVMEFNATGICKINIDKVVQKWGKLWVISQWKEKFTLIKYKQKNSPITIIKVQISKEQAMILSDKLGLLKYRNPVFKNGAIWKRSRI